MTTKPDKRRVWFEPQAVPGIGLRGIDFGLSRGLFGWLGMHRVLWRDFDGRCHITNELAVSVECDRERLT